MSTVNYTTIEARLTAERLSSYRCAAEGDLIRALQLYDWNTEMAGALHEDLGRFEVIFRNALDAALRDHAAERLWPEAWYRRQELFPGRVARRARADIATARFRATLGGLPERHGKVIAELNLGFWRFLCASAYLTSLWVPALGAAFPHHPACGDAFTVRRDVEDRVQRLHFLRNRIAHHEPIHQRDLQRDHADLLELVGWICDDSRVWIGAGSRTATVLSRKATG